VRYEDTRLLQRWARLQLQIAIAKAKREPIKLDPDGKPDLTRVDEGVDLLGDGVLRSNGYRSLVAWFKSLTPRPRSRWRDVMRNQIAGVEKLKRQIEEQGDTFDYAELDISIRADPQGNPVEAPING
jgi:hypothetical protein